MIFFSIFVLHSLFVFSFQFWDKVNCFPFRTTHTKLLLSPLAVFSFRKSIFRYWKATPDEWIVYLNVCVCVRAKHNINNCAYHGKPASVTKWCTEIRALAIFVQFLSIVNAFVFSFSFFLSFYFIQFHWVLNACLLVYLIFKWKSTFLDNIMMKCVELAFGWYFFFFSCVSFTRDENALWNCSTGRRLFSIVLLKICFIICSYWI